MKNRGHLGLMLGCIVINMYIISKIVNFDGLSLCHDRNLFWHIQMGVRLLFMFTKSRLKTLSRQVGLKVQKLLLVAMVT